MSGGAEWEFEFSNIFIVLRGECLSVRYDLFKSQIDASTGVVSKKSLHHVTS